MSNDTPDSKLYEMVVRGKNYRETIELEMFGETVEVIIRPLPDKIFIPLTGRLEDKFDMDEEEAIDAIEDAKESGDTDFIDVSEFDTEFVELMAEAAKAGIVGEDMGHTDEEVEWMVDNMVGGFSLEIGGEVLELSGDIIDAEKFR